MTYDMDNYRQDALRTESPVTPEVQRRLVRAYEIVQEYMQESKHNGEMLDRVKRYVFYGKPDDELTEQLLPTHPTGDKRERIEQCARLLHGLIGVMTEAGEMCDAVLNYIENGGQLDFHNLREECGDELWYLNIILDFCGACIVETAERNIAKLKVRFPQKFSTEHALNRNLAAENQALQG